MNNYVKAGIAIAVIIVAALIIVPKLGQQDPVSTGTNGTGDGSSLTMIQNTLKNGKATLLLLRTSG